MSGTVKRWGNSAAIRIPAAILEAMSIGIDTRVDVREENGRIVIEPIREPGVDLDEMLSRITPENIHAAVDFGKPAGREIW